MLRGVFSRQCAPLSELALGQYEALRGIGPPSPWLRPCCGDEASFAGERRGLGRNCSLPVAHRRKRNSLNMPLDLAGFPTACWSRGEWLCGWCAACWVGDNRKRWWRAFEVVGWCLWGPAPGWCGNWDKVRGKEASYICGHCGRC